MMQKHGSADRPELPDSVVVGERIVVTLAMPLGPSDGEDDLFIINIQTRTLKRWVENVAQRCEEAPGDEG